MSEGRESLESPTPAPEARTAPRVRTLLLCDLAESTAMVERLGDVVAADLMRRHDRRARDLMHRFEGREIDKTDGFLLLFERSVQAVAFALAYQRMLHDLTRDHGPAPGAGRPNGAELGNGERLRAGSPNDAEVGNRERLSARVGIHVGEVVVWENEARDVADGAKRLEVEGLAKPVAARLMHLALPGQILLSGVAFTLAQRAAPELEQASELRWLTHGRYRFKGVAAPMLVHEVGLSGFAPLQAPPSTSKAQRDVPMWRRPGALALEGIALLAAVAVPFALSLRATPAIAFAERDWVVVGEMRNLTGETLLDDSLQTAFRISLEQSRYVNVLSDLKLRDSLARMQKPADTDIDRVVASEVALREGARAVILPTVAEIGGRVRVSAEVIDPHTQTTVYAESADGVGAESTLDSIDTVTHTLREKLGEALASIEKDSAPLPQVTTANLDALRAYALGDKAYADSNYKDAQAYFDQAVKLDPKFALSHIGRARVAYSLSDNSASRAALTRAQSHRDRLTARDGLYLDAWGTTFGRTEDKLRQWALLGKMYPDFFVAHFNYAHFVLLEAGQPEMALEAAQRAEAPQSSTRSGAILYRAIAQLALDRLDQSLSSINEVMAIAPKISLTYSAYPHAAKRDYATAQATLEANAQEQDGRRTQDVLEARIALEIDRGDFAAATLLETRSIDDDERVDIAGTTLVKLMRSSVGDAPEVARAVIDQALARWTSMPGEEKSRERSETHNVRLLALAFVAARMNAVEPARTALKNVQGELLGGGLDRTRLYELTKAELARAEGEPAVALERIDALLAQAAHPFLLRSARLRALLALGRDREALELAEALARARGAAYASSGFGGNLLSLRLLSLADANVALLDAAEVARRLGDNDRAQRNLRAFLQAWPAAREADRWRGRVESLLREPVPPTP